MNGNPLSLSLILLLCFGLARATEPPPNLSVENLVAWCVVPFDASGRGPEERATMLAELGFRYCAYDWRSEHVVEFEEEILAYKKHGIEMFAFWKGHPDAYALFRKHAISPQVWHTVPSPDAKTQQGKVTAAVAKLEPLVIEAAEHGCEFGLYNHGGWGGEPRNLVAVCEALRKKGHQHVGIVYNWHHAHASIDSWESDLELLIPWLLCLNLNGMNSEPDPKILVLGEGEHEATMLSTLIASGYEGPIGILDHQRERDTRAVLTENLAGLDQLLGN
ncbi:MAG: hypothetical protein AAF236_08005 [Verrucomicrobiota bacterium]